MSEQSREAFEAWLVAHPDLPIPANAAFAKMLMQTYEHCWRASRAAALEEAVKVCEDVADEYNRSEGGKWPELKSDAQSGASACESAIRSLANPAERPEGEKT